MKARVGLRNFVSLHDGTTDARKRTAQNFHAIAFITSASSRLTDVMGSLS